MTQQDLSTAAKVDLKTVNSFEARNSWPIARSRGRIEKALGWEPGALQRIAEEEPDEPTPRLSETARRMVREELGDELAARVIAHADHLSSGRAGEDREIPPSSPARTDRRSAG